MPFAHICHDCGLDLARVRVRRDPHYGLPIVTCPQCRRTVVRRPHPLLRSFRNFRRFDWSLTIVAANAAMLVLLLGLMTAWISTCVFISRDHTLGVMWDEHPIPLLLGGVALPVCLGAWLTVGLPHWTRPAAWITFGLLAMGCVGLVAIGIGIDEVVSWRTEATLRGVALGGFSPARLDRTFDLLLRGTALLVLLMTASTAGVVPGRLIAWLMRAVRSGIFRWRHNRGRRERQT